jgi:VIT1/CCC1 family predicted Fe2+/Mn2+ transporter
MNVVTDTATPRRDPAERTLAPASAPTRRTVERALLREVLMGAQDNLTNVLAVVLGVAVGAGRADMVALAGLAAGIAEAISMGGVLYTGTQADRDLDAQAAREGALAVGPEAGVGRPRLTPFQAGAVTFGAGMVAGLVPLIPFMLLPLIPAMAVCVAISVAALFGLGTWTASVTGRSRVRDGVRLVVIAGTAAIAAAIVGAILRID